MWWWCSCGGISQGDTRPFWLVSHYTYIKGGASWLKYISMKIYFFQNKYQHSAWSCTKVESKHAQEFLSFHFALKSKKKLCITDNLAITVNCAAFIVHFVFEVCSSACFVVHHPSPRWCKIPTPLTIPPGASSYKFQCL